MGRVKKMKGTGIKFHRGKGIKMERKRMITAFLFLAPSFIGVLVFVFIPFLDAVRRSFYEAMSGKFVGLSNYETVFQNEAFQNASVNTLRFIAVCIPLLLAVSLALALLLNTMKNKSEFFKTTFLIPMAIPAASVVLLWKVFFHNRGLLNGFLMALDLSGQDWINSDKAFAILVFSYIWKNAGYDMVLWLAGLSNIPPSLYEAASLDGASALKQFWYITLPALMPTFFIITVLSLLNSFKVFREAYLIAGDYPNDSIYMLQHLFNNWFTKLDIQKMCAAAVIVAVVILLFILLLQKFWGEGEEDEN